MRLFFAPFGLLITACAPFDAMDRTLDPYSRPNPAEVAFPGVAVDGSGSVEVEAADGATYLVPYVLQADTAVTGGDMLLGSADGILERAAGVTTARRWNTCQIPFSIDPSLSFESEMDLRRAIATWESNTALSFIEDPTATNRIVVQGAAGCASNVGMKGGPQIMLLGSTCGTGAAIHEVGHAVGLWHEQSRSDAPDYVAVHWDNIEAGRATAFQTYEQRSQPGVDLGPYDFGSVMHYASGTFATGTCHWMDSSGCSLTHLDGSYIFEHQRERLSPGDLAAVDVLYGSMCGAAPTDDHGNTDDTATPIASSSTTPGTLTSGDVDVFALSVEPGQQVRIETTGSVDTIGTVWGGGQVVEQEDDGGQGSNFRIVFTAQHSDLRIHVAGFSESATGAYQLVVQTAADSAPAPMAEEIRFESPGQIDQSEVLTAGETKIFRIEALVGGALSAWSEGSTDTYATLYAADNTVLDENDDSEGINFGVTAPIEAGTYFLHIRGYSSTTTGPYNLRAELE